MSRHFRQHIMIQVHLHIRPEVRGQPRPAQRGLGPGAQVRFQMVIIIVTRHNHIIVTIRRSAARADSGQYQCQVSTTPIITHDVWLTVKGETSDQSAQGSIEFRTNLREV